MLFVTRGIVKHLPVTTYVPQVTCTSLSLLSLLTTDFVFKQSGISCTTSSSQDSRQNQFNIVPRGTMARQCEHNLLRSSCAALRNTIRRRRILNQVHQECFVNCIGRRRSQRQLSGSSGLSDCSSRMGKTPSLQASILSAYHTHTQSLPLLRRAP